MKKQLSRICSGVLLLSSFSFAALVQAQSLDDLLDQARGVREAENALFDQRAAEWAAAPAAQQQTMLQTITAERDRLQTVTRAQGEEYAQNDIEINELNTQLRDKANSFGLGELFGQARQFATDQTSPMEQSLISAQFADEDPSRVEFLDALGSSQTIVSTADLEKLWLEVQREMTAQGQVAKFTGTVVQPDGEPTNTTITRIGPFTATADGRYLAYLPELNRLNVLPRQPAADIVEPVAALEAATSGYVLAYVDQTRGVLMGMYTERPTVEERIELGEEVGYVILVVGAISAVAFIFQFVYLVMARIGVSRQMKNLNKPMANNALGRVLLSFKSNERDIEEDAEIVELRISEAVLKEIPKLERVQPLLRLAVAAGPLLGLVGTVVGMIITFQSITETGSSDPKLMATGIGQAMIATVLGLGIAVPFLFANAALNSLSRSIVQILDEQSTGMLAEQLERRKKNV
jgi:biopolymer transport protein ExbB